MTDYAQAAVNEVDLLFCRTCGEWVEESDADVRVSDFVGRYHLNARSEICGPVLDAIIDSPYVIDPETGEILSILPALAGGKEPFRVRDQSSAEWVMERIFEAESEIAALHERRRILDENIESMIREQEGRASWLRKRFGAELQGWAASLLKGSRSRTVKTPFGRLSFRKTRRRIEVHDEIAAIAWAETNAPNAVKVTKKFLTSVIADVVLFEAPPGCAIVPEGETFKIVTGMEP